MDFGKLIDSVGYGDKKLDRCGRPKSAVFPIGKGHLGRRSGPTRLQEGAQVAQLKEKAKTLHLTIKATNNAAWKTGKFKTDNLVGEVAREALRHFVNQGQMEDGDYGLALVAEGQPNREVDDAATLGDSGVPDGATLALVARKPQVDG